MKRISTSRIFWLIMAILPVITYIIFARINQSAFTTEIETTSAVEFSYYLEIYYGFTPNFMTDILYNIFGSGGVLPITSGLWLCYLISYWVILKVVHIVSDLFSMIPDILHKLTNKLTGEDKDYD